MTKTHNKWFDKLLMNTTGKRGSMTAVDLLKWRCDGIRYAKLRPLAVTK